MSGSGAQIAAIATNVQPPVNSGALLDNLAELNDQFSGLSAAERAAYAVENFPGTHILSSSFGAQAAVGLHLLTQIQADIPVVLIDTGYLFPETYAFVEQLRERLNLNLHTWLVWVKTVSPIRGLLAGIRMPEKDSSILLAW